MTPSYGHFDDAKREYVITRPDTPLPWINYLGCDDFFGIISNTAGGYSFYQDARMRRLLRYRYNSIPFDMNGRYLYIKDEEVVWNPGWKPVRTALDSYECRHGMGYTQIRSVKNDLEVTVTWFIPVGNRHEVWDVKIRNLSQSKKSFQLWGFVEWCLWDAQDDMTNFQRNFSTGEVEVEDNTIFHKTEYRERRNHYAWFHLNRPHDGFDTSRDAFVGLHRGLEDPKVVEEGHCTNSIAHGWSPVGVHQLNLSLNPGEETRFHFLLGYSENPKDQKFISQGVIRKDEYQNVKSDFNSSDSVDNAFGRLKSHWDQLLGVYKVETENPIVNRQVNIWNQYQCMTTFNLSRSASFYESGVGRGMGYRDSNQDILGFVHMIPDRARQRILEIASTQLSDGTCYHQYQPLTKKGNAAIGGGFNDDPLWLVLSTSAYIKETGDYTILNENIGYADQDEKQGSLLDHLELSIQYILNNRGPHGLPLIGHADWNDCLNLNCLSETPGESFQTAPHRTDGETAESLMIGGLFCAAAREMTLLYKQLNNSVKSKYMQDLYFKMEEAVYAHGWDGDWFLRAYDAQGKKVGSSENEEGKIFIESQGWCILGHLGFENGYAEKSLNAVKKHLATEDGILLNQPAFQTYHKELGEISSYPPGYKENASIFTHNNTWIQAAAALLGRGEEALEYYLSICPSSKEEMIDTYRAEPYVYSQMTAGRDAPTPGEGKNSWLSGTAAWSFVVISQYILGIKPHYNGLEINPCISKEWGEIRVQRKFRNAIYDITIQNPDPVEKGILTATVDGVKQDSNLIPLFDDGETHQIVVVMGK